jgi:predicted permease
MLRSILREVPFVVRGLLRRPAVPSVLALVVAVGVTFLATGYTVFDGLLWRELPYGPAERWMVLGETYNDAVGPMPRSRVDTWAAYQDAHERGRLPAVEAFIPLEERDVNLTMDGVASGETATWLLPASFPHLQTPPLLGRYPADPDGAGRLAREIAIGQRLWHRRFGGRPDVLGQRVTVNDESAVIVGVMPDGFQFHRMSDVWVAWSRAEIMADPDREMPLVVRLAEGATRSQVLDQTEPVRRAVFLARTPPDSLRNGHSSESIFGTTLVPPQLAQLVLATMTLVLLAACLNIATLYLARLRLRAPEHATRQALGAGPSGVLRHLGIEVGLIVGAGGVLAVLATAFLTDWIHGSLGAVLPFDADLRLGWHGVVATLLALAAALAIVSAPALRVARRLDLARLLGHHGVIGGAPRHTRGAGALIATQVAIVVILAAASVPIAVSAVKLADVTSGRDDDRVVEVNVALLGARYEAPEARDAYAERARQALAADARVEAVARVGPYRQWRATSVVWSDSLFTDAEAAPLPWRRRWRLDPTVVSDDYFRVVGLDLVAGRGFDAGLQATDEPVAVLAVEAARQHFPGRSPLGRRFRRGTTGTWVRVIGVVEDDRGIYEDWGGTTVERQPKIYLSERQAVGQLMTLQARVGTITPALLHDVRATVAGVDPSQSVEHVRPLIDIFRGTVVERRWMAIVLGSGVVVAVLLAAIGTFGLVTYYTTARLRELALRVALGAPVAAVVWLVARRTLRSVAVGLGVGALTLGVMERGVERFAYGTSVWDPPALALIAVLVAIVAAAAMLVPLRRVRGLAPQELLRAE